MAGVSASDVRELREKTGAGMMDCKKALQETNGNLEEAVTFLRKKGLSKAAKKSGRVAAEGAVGSYIHGEGSIGVLVEVNCETDFVARNEDFKAFVKDISMHIAASHPKYLSKEEITEDEKQKEMDIIRAQLADSGKPPAVLEKIVAGKLNKFAEEYCLMEQPFVKDPDKTVEQLRKETVAKLGENIQIRRFSRFELGEGIEKKSENLSEEVAKQLENTKKS
jgi:elongation factor Ts